MKTPLSVAVAQLDCVVGDISGNARRILDAVARAKAAGADVVLDVVQQLHGMPGNDDVVGIRSKAATGDLTQAVSEWLSANPLT